MSNLTNSTIYSASKTMYKINYGLKAITIGERSFSPNLRVIREDRWGFVHSVSLDQEMKEVFGFEMEGAVLRRFDPHRFLYSRLKEQIEGKL